MDKSKKHQLFDQIKMDAIIKRIALQIHESNIEEKQLFIVGIANKGNILAKKIANFLKDSMTMTEIVLMELQIDKSKPLGSIKTSLNVSECEDHTVVIIDDVLNTGSTLVYAVHHFLKVPLKKIQTAVLVNRNHKRFPIKADFKGISLSTSYKEHVSVSMEGPGAGAYLS